MEKFVLFEKLNLTDTLTLTFSFKIAVVDWLNNNKYFLKILKGHFRPQRMILIFD
jgi:hypothetical protein